MPSPTAAVSSLVGMAALMLASTAPSSQVPRQLTTPAGFELSIYADSVVNAREMVRGPNGTLFVGTLRVGTVHALVDSDGDHTVDRRYVIASGLDQPNGVAFRGNALYVATASQILRYDDVERRLSDPPRAVVVRDSLPSQDRRGHRWKFIGFGPDDMLYTSSGAPCNVCMSPENVSAILRLPPDGSSLETCVAGVRNSVGFDWHPESRELWFTDNGRDMMGDDVPSDELNVASRPGMHFGFPYCHQREVPDPQFGAQRACSTTEPPVRTLGAHVAALGFPFYTGRMFPASYRNAVIVALHGSWNRSTPSGYRVMVARTGGRRVTSYEPLVDGFFAGANAAAGGRAAGNDAIGRRADVMQLPDGSILISDDSGNRIYRLSYRSASAVPAQGRSAITINDTGVQPENVTSSADGSVYFGSMLKGTIYRAVPGATQAEPWLLASEVGLTNVLGVLAHDASNTLWVCQNSTGGRGGAPVTGQTALRSFNLTTGTPKDRYDFPSNGGVCNDIAVGADGTVYATESFANRIHRLRPGATALDVWFTDAQIGVIDGIALLSDGAVYVNGFNSGRLFRVPVRADGSAGALEPITTSLPLTRPDGLRSVGPMTLLQAEQGGRLAELRVTGARAEVRVIRDSLPRASGVTLVGGNAMVLVELSRAVVVPYPPR